MINNGLDPEWLYSKIPLNQLMSFYEMAGEYQEEAERAQNKGGL